MSYPFNETPEEHSARLERQARWAMVALAAIAAVGLFFAIAAVARAWVWIKWAFA